MNVPGTPPDPLPEVDEREESISSLLRSERPIPAASFRGDLRRHLFAGRGPLPRRSGVFLSLGVRIAGCLGAGVVLLAIAGAGLAGAGPFAA